MASPVSSDNERYVPLMQFTTLDALQQADSLCAYLQANGVETRLVDDNTLSIMPHYGVCIEGVKVTVPRDQREQALRLIASPPVDGDTPTSDIPENDNAPPEPATRCPECGADAVTNRRFSPGAAILLAIAFIALFPLSILVLLPFIYYRIGQWSCTACGWRGSPRDLS